jgi:tetratricopeptide (TPR) repeat protein
VPGRAAAPEAPPRAGLEAFHEGRHGDAERLLTAEMLRLERQEPGSAAAAQAIVDLAELYRGQARFAEAEALFTRAIAMLDAMPGLPASILVRPLNSLALVYRAQGLYAQAEPLCRRALALAESSYGPEHAATASVVSNLLTIYLAQGRYGDAAPLFERSVTLKERLLGPQHPDLASSLNTYAAFLRKMQNEREAAAWEARARAISGEPAGRSVSSRS